MIFAKFTTIEDFNSFNATVLEWYKNQTNDETVISWAKPLWSLDKTNVICPIPDGYNYNGETIEILPNDNRYFNNKIDGKA